MSDEDFLAFLGVIVVMVIGAALTDMLRILAWHWLGG